VLRLSKKGLKGLGGRGVGDLLVKVTVETPKKLSADERRLLEQLRELDKRSGENRNPKLFDKMKDVLGR
jgi:molecular chaperone DnaJ